MRQSRLRAGLAASLVLTGVALALGYAGGAGAARPVGPTQAVTPDAAFGTALAHNTRRGEYLVAYTREPDDRQRDPTVTFARRLDRNGAVRGPETRPVTTPPELSPGGQELAYNPRRDEYLLIWRAAPKRYGPPWELYGQRLSSNGAAIGKPRTLLRAGEQEERHLNCCDELRVTHDPRSDGYLVTWRGERGVIGPQAVMGRRVGTDLRPGPVRQLTGDFGFFSHDVAWTGSGYVVAGWGVRHDGTDHALRTRAVDAAGRGRGKERVVARAARARGVALAREGGADRLAVAWSLHTGGVRIQALDRLGRPTRPPAAVGPNGDYVETNPSWLSYNRRADRYLLGWVGWREDPRNEDRSIFQSAVRTLRGDGARPLGEATVVPGHFGGAGASTREPRWLTLLAGSGALRARPFGP